MIIIMEIIIQNGINITEICIQVKSILTMILICILIMMKLLMIDLQIKYMKTLEMKPSKQKLPLIKNQSLQMIESWKRNH